MESKFWGAYHIARAARIRAGGSLTFVSGFLSVRPGAWVLQGAINAALESLARGLALELSPVRVNAVSPWPWPAASPSARRQAGVTVNSVLPGPTLSDGFRSMFEAQAEKEGRSIEELGRDFVVSQRPSSILRRPTTPEEVANVFVYLCSREASGWITPASNRRPSTSVFNTNERDRPPLRRSLMVRKQRRRRL
ncbi:hypothetical protein [uncultured Brevundimonas sp.]|jgi:NAD(P)-dependent dehydrogenase (short-subunit alcohol dehydrogenase family)|uniref:hypothetical protein n=1 Tax=uncultured Brevundimonas sp. TaxID=213418 RepID=UPI00261728D7|nr:hypothetical protein [uncultured Brevundimonas sp.]